MTGSKCYFLDWNRVEIGLNFGLEQADYSTNGCIVKSLQNGFQYHD